MASMYNMRRYLILALSETATIYKEEFGKDEAIAVIKAIVEDLKEEGVSHDDIPDVFSRINMSIK